ncbi:MAG: serine hydroxymethyltransferase [Chloroflexi bacterium]|nr:serine hydroxymethyltransferase [Chloroflexota bacterium]|tara:strand:+ start:329 stop:1570 length:1242 start_codon:yes stop_codon:yes gene_type:complete
MTNLSQSDSEIYSVIEREKKRQKEQLVMIASENYASSSVLETTGSILTNKYSEGYPGKRYYAGCENVDISENLAIERAKSLFNAESANVQAHSGSQANMAAFFAMCNPGDTIMGMSLDHGGHLTHGSKVNFSGKLYNFIPFGVDRETEALDFSNLQEIADKNKPRLIIAGFTAYPLSVDFEKFKSIADSVDALLLADMAHISGLIAGGAHPSPVPYADIVTSTTHKTLRGPRGALALMKKNFEKKYNSAVFPNMQGGPMQNSIAAKAVAFKEAMTKEFQDYSFQIVKNSKFLSKKLSENGLRIVAGGTDTHMLLVDTKALGLTGSNAESALLASGIVVNKNSIPFDNEPPMVTSGIRIGTAALTSRNMREKDMETISEFILESLKNHNNPKLLESIREKVVNFSAKFIVPGLD